MTKESERKLTTSPVRYILLNHKGNDALEELQISSINELETTSMKTGKQVIRQGRSGRPRNNSTLRQR
jgi:hypothetical protein